MDIVNNLWKLARALDYVRDPDPKHWKTINGSHVHLDGNGNYDGGAGSKFNGRHHYGPGWKEKTSLMNRLAAALHAGANKSADVPKKPSEEPSNSDTIKEKLLPSEIAGVKKGKPMNEEHANEGHANPHFSEGTGYRINCQTCVVAYELRRRGYNVEAKGNDGGAYFSKLSKNPAEAWIDPKTGLTPEPITDSTVSTALRTYNWLKKTLDSEGRYTVWFGWKGGNSGHIVHVRKTSDEDVELYDPQCGEIRAKGKEEIREYFSRVRYRVKYWDGSIVTPPKLLRVDTLIPNTDLLGHVLSKGDDLK